MLFGFYVWVVAGDDACWCVIVLAGVGGLCGVADLLLLLAV